MQNAQARVMVKAMRELVGQALVLHEGAKTAAARQDCIVSGVRMVTELCGAFSLYDPESEAWVGLTALVEGLPGKEPPDQFADIRLMLLSLQSQLSGWAKTLDV